MARLRCGDACAQLVGGVGIGIATAYRYSHERALTAVERGNESVAPRQRLARHSDSDGLSACSVADAVPGSAARVVAAFSGGLAGGRRARSTLGAGGLCQEQTGAPCRVETPQ